MQAKGKGRQCAVFSPPLKVEVAFNGVGVGMTLIQETTPSTTIK